MNISPELLSEVLGKKVYRTKMYGSNYIDVHYDQERYMPVFDRINIYEIAHKCKEWAFNKNKFLSSGISKYAPTDKKNRMKAYYCRVGYKVYACHTGTVQINNGCEYTSLGNSEPEAIFKACEWILKQKENK